MECELLDDEQVALVKLFLAVNISHEILYNVAKDLYMVHEKSENGTRNIDEFCIEIKGRGLRKVMGKNFPKDFSFTKGEDLDVSFCQLFITDVVFDKKWMDYPSGKDLMDSVRDIKNIRNKVCHKFNYKAVNWVELKDILISSINKLSNAISTLFKDCKYKNYEKYKVHYTDLREKSIHNINKVWESKIAENKSEFKTLLKKLDDDKFTAFVGKCQLELIECYKKLYSDPFFFLNAEDLKFDVSSVFVPLALSCHNKSLSYKDLLSHKNPKKDKPPEVVLISGDAGTGKTTLCRKIVMEWCESQRGMKIKSNSKKKRTSTEVALNEYDLVLLIEVKRAKERSLYQYLKEVLLYDIQELLDANEMDVIFFLNQLKLLIIIDAFDERPLAAQDLIESLLSNFPDKKILITSRPHCNKETWKCLVQYELLYLDVQLHGFENHEIYIDKVIKEVNKKGKRKFESKNFKDYLKNLSVDFQKALKVPLINILLLYLWINKNEGIKRKTITFTNLYSEILNLQKENILSKVTATTKTIIDDTVIENLIKKIAQDSFEQLKNKNVKKLNGVNEHLLSEVELNPDFIKTFLSGIFLSTPCIRSLKKKGYDYEYFHKTQQEFFVAYHAVQLLLTDTAHSLKDLEIFDWDNLLTHGGELSFVIGLLQLEKRLGPYVEELCCELCNYEDEYNFLWKILSQTMSRALNSDSNSVEPDKELCSSYKSILRHEIRLNQTDVVSGLYLIKYTNYIPRRLVIDIEKTCDPFSIPSFQISFIDLQNSLKNRSLPRSVKSDIELYFRDLGENSQKNHDDFLHCLKKSKCFNLIKFDGYLEMEGLRILKDFDSLKYLTLFINSVSCLNCLNESIMDKEKLRKLSLTIGKELMKETELPKLSNSYADIYITLSEVEEELYIRSLQNLKPRGNNFYVVQLKLSRKPKKQKGSKLSLEEFFIKMNNFVDKKLIVHSNYEITDDMKFRLNSHITYEFEWFF